MTTWGSGGIIHAARVSIGWSWRGSLTTDELIAFGPVLSRYRIASGLTQEELAERAGLSVRGISDLERGVNKRPRAHTVRQLAGALQLSADDRALFEQAARTAGTGHRVADVRPEGNFLGALPTGPLVGREEELTRIRAVFDSVSEGTGHLLFLNGETGAGKTRLAQEVMVEARAGGMVVLTGRCYGTQRSTPYYPFLEALAQVASAAQESVRNEGQRAWKRVQDVLGPFSRDNGTGQTSVMAQQQLFEAVTDLLLLVARSTPLVLLLDDLQWADGESLTLLQQIARVGRGSRILVAATFREGRLSEESPDLAQTLQILSRERLVERITVRRLSVEETTSLVAAIMGEPSVSEEFASFVYRRTKGNPRLIDQLVRSLGGRLELQGEIGAGSMGRVFRAFDRTTDRTVAAKLLLARSEIDLDTLLRFQKEGAVLSKLKHPHIVDIHDTFAEEHASCIIMELLDGPSLGQLLGDGPLPLDRAMGIALQVADALAYAHSQEIVHRDIKPDNVMLLADDQVKVTDFGIARILQPDTSLQTIATTGMRMGTPLYMAPEQIEGKKIDGRTDIYALGAMLYHMVLGRPPFEGSDALAVAVKHLQEEPLPPSQVNPRLPQEWDAFILKALAKDPKGRFQSVTEMAKAIGALSAEPTTREAALLPSRVARVAISSALVTVLAVLLVAAAVLRSHLVSVHTQPALGRKLDAYLTYLTNQHRMSGTVLVARLGHIILSKGYGLADRQHHVANGPAVKYPSIANFSINLTAALKLGEEGKLRPGAHICTYLPHCPATWMPLTVRQVVDGTSGLPAINWGLLPGAPAQSLSSCQTSGLEVPPFGRTDFQNCDTIVLGTIIEKITHQPWEAAIRRTVLDPTGMHNTARLTDALKPPGRADDYNSSASGAAFSYGPYFELYSTAPDILRYDDALFGGKLLSAADLRAALTPRDASPDPGIPDARNASLDFKIGRLAGQSVIYRYGTTDLNFTGINMYFPGDSVTIVVASNVRQDDALPIGVNLAKLLYGRTVIFPVPQGHIPSAPSARAIQATIDVQTNVSGLALAHRAIWLGNDNIGTVTRVNTRTNQVGGITPLSQVLVGPPGYVGAVAAEGGQVWVDYNGGQEAMRLDPVTGKVAQRVRVASLLGDMSIANGILWATSATDNVRRIDPRSGRVERVGRAFGLPEELATGGGSVWVSSRRSATVRRIDARTGRIVATIHVGTDPETVALGYGSVWVANGTGGYVSRIDPRTNKVVTQIAVGHDELVTGGGPCCHDIAVGYGAVWVAVHRDHKLVRIDPTTNRATSQLTLPIPPQLTRIDVWDVLTGEGSVWVHAEPHLLYRIDPKAVA